MGHTQVMAIVVLLFVAIEYLVLNCYLEQMPIYVTIVETIAKQNYWVTMIYCVVWCKYL